MDGANYTENKMGNTGRGRGEDAEQDEKKKVLKDGPRE